MSITPNGLLPAGRLPTGQVWARPQPIFRVAESRTTAYLQKSVFWLPHGYLVVPLPSAAYSHSASVGNRRPAHLQKAEAWIQVTQLTGCLFTRPGYL
jgi:hypothetical protein